MQIKNFVDRVDFGVATSQAAHAVAADADASASQPPAGKGAFGLSYRQPLLSALYSPKRSATEQLEFTLKVDPVKQNYLTVKLWGSDCQFGVLKMMDAETGFSNQLDNNLSNGCGNPAFAGRFHYATTALPIAKTKGQTSFRVALFSEGYYYDSGKERVGQPTRPIYSAFAHVEPAFVPAPEELVGAAPEVKGYTAPVAISRKDLLDRARGIRGNIFDKGNTDGAWHPGGWLKEKTEGVITADMGAPPEVLGMKIGNGPIKPETVAYFNNSAHPADAWRNAAAGSGLGVAIESLQVGVTGYLLKPFKNENGVVETGYDRYLDDGVLRRIVGAYDGLARSQSAAGMWDSSCIQGTEDSRWQGVTSTPRQVGYWAASKARQHAGCVSFEGEKAIHISRSMLSLLNDDPAAAAAFKVYLNQNVDAELNGVMVKRAVMYQRLLKSAQGFNLNAMTSTNYFDKYGGTVYQTLLDIQNFYGNQLALRQLQALFPDPTYPALAPELVRTVMRQVLGMDPNTYMAAPAGSVWWTITRGGLAENYGTQSSGYDGRYGSGVPVTIGAIVAMSKYDPSLTSVEREFFVNTARNTIAAFNSFLYPQPSLGYNADGTTTAYYGFAQEDAISYRVPYGPNANGGKFVYNIQLDAVVPSGVIKSTMARRSFFLATALGITPGLDNMAFVPKLEEAWADIAGVDPKTVAPLPGEPGQPDFVWADVDSGAVALAYKDERLFINAQFNRDRGAINNYARVHHQTPKIDRQATVLMPFNDATVQDDGNLSGGVDGLWVVRFGHYLVALNRSRDANATVKLPGKGTATAVKAGKQIPLGGTQTLLPGAYEVYVLP